MTSTFINAKPFAALACAAVLAACSGAQSGGTPPSLIYAANGPAPVSSTDTPAHVGIVVVDPVTGQTAFTTNRQLTPEEQLRVAAQHCHGLGKTLTGADLGRTSVVGGQGTTTQAMCQ